MYPLGGKPHKASTGLEDLPVVLLLSWNRRGYQNQNLVSTAKHASQIGSPGLDFSPDDLVLTYLQCVAFSIECKIPTPKRKKTAGGKQKDSDRYGGP
jgi:hypothetical protein